MQPSSPLALPLGADHDRLPPAARRSLIAGVVAAHLGLGWALLQVAAVRQAVSELAPLMLELIAPAALPAPPPAPAPPPPRRLVKHPPPAPIVTSAAAPSPSSFVAPPPPAEPPAPVMDAPAAPAAPPLAPAPASAPKTIPATAVQYLDPPAPVYPPLSKRLAETGRVLLRVEIDTEGRARQLQLSRSSGHARPDEAALAAVRLARFKPYTENGVPQVVWTTVPIVFELEN